jgi:hypothetical protein
MALNPYTTISKLRQPGSVLQPKPGVLDAGGNQPTPVLSQPEQSGTQPSITPQSQYKPTADPVNPQNNPLSYQEAYTQGRLNQPSAPAQTGGFGGYNPNQAPANYDPRAWAMSSEQVKDPSVYGQARVNPDGSTSWISPEQFNQEQWTKSGRTGAPPAVGTTLPGFSLPNAGAPSTGAQYASADAFRAHLAQNPMANTPNPLTAQLNKQLGEERGSAVTPQITPAGGKPGAFNETAIAKSKGLPSGALPSANTGGIRPMSNVTAPTPTPPSTVEQEQDPLSRLFEHFKGELGRERDQGLDAARTNAASRGVFYGTPGTQMEDEVRERYGRGLGDLSANLLQRGEENQLARLGLGANLFSQMQQNELGRLGLMGSLIPQDIDGGDGIDPQLFAALAGLFGGGSSGYDVTDQVKPVPNVKSLTPQITPAKLPSRAKNILTKMPK